MKSFKNILDISDDEYWLSVVTRAILAWYFFGWVTSNPIPTLILPPHSTYRPQPLDAGLFQLLATTRTKQPNKLNKKTKGKKRKLNM